MEKRIVLFFLFLIQALFIKATITLNNVTHISVSCSGTPDSFGALSVTSTLSGASYNWSGPGGYTGFGSSITGLTVPGKYTVTASVFVKGGGGSSESATFSVGYYADYSYFTGTDEVTVNNQPALKNISGSNNWCRGAGSKNILAGGYDGWAEYKVTATNTHRIFGFSEYVTTSHCWGYMEYGVYLKNNAYLYRVISGSQTYIGTYAVNDLIRIERNGTNFNVYLNNVQIDTYSIGATGQSKDLLLEASIYSANGLLENIGLSFKPPMNLDIAVNNISCGETTGGSITVTPCGSGYSYQWAHGPTTATVTNLSQGTYSVTITDGNGWMVKKEISVGYDVNWINAYNVSILNNSLINSGGSGITWDAGANSETKILANTDGWVEYEIKGLDKERAIGLATTPISTHPLSSINYGVVIHADGTGQKTLSGTLSGIMGHFKEGDIIRIQREGSNVYWYQGGFKRLISSVSAAEDLFVEASFSTISGMFSNVRSSVYCSFYPQSFAKPENKLDGTYYIAERGHLFIMYSEKYSYGDLKYRILNKTGSVVLDSDQFAVSKQFGANWFDWNLNSFPGFNYEEFYTLEITNDKNQKEYLRFKFWEQTP